MSQPATPFGRVASTPHMPGSASTSHAWSSNPTPLGTQSTPGTVPNTSMAFGTTFGGPASNPNFGGQGASNLGFGGTTGAAASPSPWTSGMSTPSFGTSTFPTPAPTPGGFGFGLGTSTPSFGAATGASAAAPTWTGGMSTPSFGTSTFPTPAPTPGGFGFGLGTSTPSYGGMTSSMMAGSTTPGFGNVSGWMSTSTPSFGGLSTFPAHGSTPSATQNTFPLQTGGMPTYVGAPHAPTLDVSALAKSYEKDDANPNYRFRTFLYRVLPRESRTRPPAADVDVARWRAALSVIGGDVDPTCTESDLWPVVASGFEDLTKRYQEQESAMEEHKNALNAFTSTLRASQRRSAIDLSTRLSRARQTHASLQHRLLALTRRCVALEASRSSKGRMEETERELAEGFRSIHERMYRRGTSLPSRASALVAATRLRGTKEKDAKRKGQEVLEEFPGSHVLFSVLQQQTEALRRLSELLRKDARDLTLVEEELMEAQENGIPFRRMETKRVSTG